MLALGYLVLRRKIVMANRSKPICHVCGSFSDVADFANKTVRVCAEDRERGGVKGGFGFKLGLQMESVAGLGADDEQVRSFHVLVFGLGLDCFSM